MGGVIAYFATSFDGYLADTQGGVSWLDRYNGAGDYGYKTFYDSIDIVLMGRKTYESSLELGQGKREFADKTSYVLTSQTSFQDNHEQHIYFTNEIDTIIQQNKNKNIRVLGGGQLYNTMTLNKQIDSYIITVVPTTLGQGIPRIHQKHDFNVQSIQSFENGIVQYTMKPA